MYYPGLARRLDLYDFETEAKKMQRRAGKAVQINGVSHTARSLKSLRKLHSLRAVATCLKACKTSDFLVKAAKRKPISSATIAEITCKERPICHNEGIVYPEHVTDWNVEHGNLFLAVNLWYRFDFNRGWPPFHQAIGSVARRRSVGDSIQACHEDDLKQSVKLELPQVPAVRSIRAPVGKSCQAVPLTVALGVGQAWWKSQTGASLLCELYTIIPSLFELYKYSNPKILFALYTITPKPCSNFIL